MRKSAACLLFIVFLFGVSCVFGKTNHPVTQGTLSATSAGGDLGLVPLKHTRVKTEISGFLARVRVAQEFENNFTEPIEAVYTFPLSQNAAVDDMTMRIGSRTIRGKILKRDEARRVYENARSRGQTASLLDQERPNIFTQSVANIMPGERIIIEISYVETLKYEDGSYEFVFPMVVGPRYIPGAPTGRQGGGFAPDTTRVPDGSRITPQVAKERAGHDISIEVNLDAGVPVENISSKLHEVQTLNLSSNSARITLKNQKTIPNRDFVLRYDVTGKRIEDAVLAHRGSNGGFFTMILQPPDRFTTADITPKEIVFVLDTSGSMSGFPLTKAKEAMKLSLENLHPQDTFNLITFAGSTRVLFPKPVRATAANLRRAQAFLASRRGGGGTEMMKAIRTALAPTDSQKHIRIVCFMTDGYVGNEGEILSEIQKHPNARIFSFGIGNSVNRFLLDKMAEESRGEVEYVSLRDDGSKAARKFYERVRTPLLTDISIDWNGMPVADVYPAKISDLFSAKPVILKGRYTKGYKGKIRLRGRVAGQEYSREIKVRLPDRQNRHDVLATLWARTRIDELTRRDYRGVQNRDGDREIRDQITNLGLEFRLLTQFTSFVAVEERIVNHGGQPRRIEVPVEMPEGVSREGVFGGKNELKKYARSGVVGYKLRATNKPVRSKIKPGYPAADSVRINRAAGGEPALEIDGRELSEFRAAHLGDKTDAKDEDEAAGGRISRLPHPLIPQDTGAWSKKDGRVEVSITVDERGRVIGAKAVSGAAVLRGPAEAAARKTVFAAPRFENEPLRMTGAIIYEFADRKTVRPAVGKMRVELTPEIKRRLLLKNKLHFWLYQLVRRIDRGETTPTPPEAGFVFGGKAEIRVILTEKISAGLRTKLKARGLEIDTEKDTEITGRIAVKKLAGLAGIKEVKYISP